MGELVAPAAALLRSIFAPHSPRSLRFDRAALQWRPPRIVKRALVIDDDQGVRRLVEAFLVKEEFEVDTAHDGLEAIRKLRTTRYTIVVCDLMMPGLSGFGVLEFIQAEQPESLRNVVVMTSRKIDETNRIVNSDFTGRILRKPFKDRELRVVVQRVLRSAASLEKK
jgi:DNA-binding response OmpR family regulator